MKLHSIILLNSEGIVKKRTVIIGGIVVAIGIGVGLYLLMPEKKPDKIRIAISPYQDLAMLTAKDDVLDANSKSRIELVTLPWEEILPSIASAGPTVDLGFGSLVEYITKYPQLNKGQSDPVVFCYPAYVFKGGVFITFNADVPEITPNNLNDAAVIKKFLSYRIGAQKNSLYEMMLFSLAKKAGINLKDIKITDTPLNDGILATQAGSLDIASAGLTQRAEARKKGARVVLSMETLGFADITGFVCRQSTLDKRGDDVRFAIQTWFKCVDFVFTDMEKNSKTPLAYLAKNAATKYTFEEYKTALGEEYFPRTVKEINREILAHDGRYSMSRIANEVSEYLNSVGIAKEPVPTPQPIPISE